jgi:hypothetical protein
MANALEIEWDLLRNRVAQLTREAERLTQELDRVQDERGKIDYALSVLERVKSTVTGHVSGHVAVNVTGNDSGHEPAVQPDSHKPLRRRSRATYDLAVRTINSSTRTWRVEELVRQMREDGWDVDVKNEVETVRAALSRAVAAGDVTRPSYGVYAAKRGIPEESPPGEGTPPPEAERPVTTPATREEESADAADADQVEVGG